MEISYSKQFIKQLKKSPVKIQRSFRKRLELFTENPGNPLLRYHALQGELKAYRSINISGDWRAIFRIDLEKGKLHMRFMDIGTHSQLYS